MSGLSWTGKTFRWTIALVPLFCVALSGCNFFGKQKETAPVLAPGELPSGESIVGTWSRSSASLSATSNPTSATTMTYSFDPTGGVRIDVRDQKSGGQICSAFGEFRVVGDNNAVIYVQAVSSTSCGFGQQMSLTDIRISSTSISYTEGSSHQTVKLYVDHAPRSQGLVGLWQFGGAGGIDYVLFDQHGYFVMQVNDQGDQVQLEGYYAVVDSALGLYFFSGEPTNVTGTVVFSQFITNGSALILDELYEDGTTSTFAGARL